MCEVCLFVFLLVVFFVGGGEGEGQTLHPYKRYNFVHIFPLPHIQGRIQDFGKGGGGVTVKY